MGLGYGATSQHEIVSHARRVAQAFSLVTAPQAMEFMLGIACAETALGKTTDKLESQGAGLLQFDQIGFDDALDRGVENKPHIKAILREEFGIEWGWIKFEHLDYSPLLSFIMCRVKLMLIPEPLPELGDIEGQARYWKKHWNSELGKGTVEHYIQSVSDNYTGGYIKSV